MQALQIRAGHDRRVRLELGDKRAAPTVRNDVTSDTSPSSTRPSRTSSVATGSPATGGTAYVGVPRMTEMPRRAAPLGTGSSQSNLNWPFSGSQVDQTDSPTRMTEKCASCMRSRSTSSRSYVHCPGHSLTLPAVNFGICLASAFALPPSTKVSSRSSADTRWARIASSAPSGSCLAIASTTARCSFFVTE